MKQNNYTIKHGLMCEKLIIIFAFLWLNRRGTVAEAAQNATSLLRRIISLVEIKNYLSFHGRIGEWIVGWEEKKRLLFSIRFITRWHSINFLCLVKREKNEMAVAEIETLGNGWNRDVNDNILRQWALWHWRFYWAIHCGFRLIEKCHRLRRRFRLY